MRLPWWFWIVAAFTFAQALGSEILLLDWVRDRFGLAAGVSFFILQVLTVWGTCRYAYKVGVQDGQRVGEIEGVQEGGDD